MLVILRTRNTSANHTTKNNRKNWNNFVGSVGVGLKPALHKGGELALIPPLRLISGDWDYDLSRILQVSVDNLPGCV